MGLRKVEPSEKHLAFRNDAIELLRKHAGELDASEMLALCAHLVGQVMAMQDQRKVTPEAALETVIANIEVGNAEVVAELIGETAGSA